MHIKKAHKLSKALIIIRDCYYAKANNLSYSKFKLASAIQYIEDICKYIDKRSDDIEREFLFSCFGALDELKEEGDCTKTSRFAEAIHRVPYLFCGEEKWDASFKEQYITPFCRMYGDEWFEDVLSMRIPKKSSLQKVNRSIYRYNEINIMSLPGYFCFRMLIPFLTIPIILGFIAYIHFSDYTEADCGKRYEITVTDCKYENTEEYDYLYISCKEFEENFEITRFFKYSNSPKELIERCEAGETLVAYAEYKQPKNYDNYYEVIQLESLDGTIYRSYEHTNQIDRYILTFLLIAAVVIFVPFFILFLMMLIVALNRQQFVSHPRFVKFCFPDYSLSLK